MNRIDRISAILIQLQSRNIVKAREIAERFDISLRTVYRDIRALEEAGVPIGAEAGKGYFITEGYHLPPVMFTREEAGSMLIAEKMVEKFTDRSVDKYYKSAMFKVKSVLDNAHKEYIKNLDAGIKIFYDKKNKNEGFPDSFIPDIQYAIAQKKVVKLHYQSYSKDEATTRDIEPMGICFYGVNWHLIAYCRLRKDYRDFRTDRIMKFVPTDMSFDISRRKGMDEYFDQLSKTLELQKVSVRFHKSLKADLERQKYYFGFMEEKAHKNYIEISFLVSQLDYFARWLLGFGKKAKVREPQGLKSLIKDMIHELMEGYL